MSWHTASICTSPVLLKPLASLVSLCRRPGFPFTTSAAAVAAAPVSTSRTRRHQSEWTEWSDHKNDCNFA
jgi:hypothetical protein